MRRAGAGIVIGILALLTLKEPKEANQPPKKPLLNKVFSLPFMSGVPPNPNAGKAAPPSFIKSLQPTNTAATHATCCQQKLCMTFWLYVINTQASRDAALP